MRLIYNLLLIVIVVGAYILPTWPAMAFSGGSFIVGLIIYALSLWFVAQPAAMWLIGLFPPREQW